MRSLEKLVSIAGESSGGRPPSQVAALLPFGPPGDQLMEMLRLKNGFYALESALHVFLCWPSIANITVERWNAPSLWRLKYGDRVAGKLFFAENVCGDQFCISDGKIALL